MIIWILGLSLFANYFLIGLAFWLAIDGGTGGGGIGEIILNCIIWPIIVFLLIKDALENRRIRKGKYKT